MAQDAKERSQARLRLQHVEEKRCSPALLPECIVIIVFHRAHLPTAAQQIALVWHLDITAGPYVARAELASRVKIDLLAACCTRSVMLTRALDIFAVAAVSTTTILIQMAGPRRGDERLFTKLRLRPLQVTLLHPRISTRPIFSVWVMTSARSLPSTFGVVAPLQPL
jgi:hypothetical protein